MTTRNSPKKKSMSLVDLLATTNKGIGEPKGVSGICANLWREIMYRENITPTRWQRALNMWTDRQMAMAKRSGVKIKKSSLTGNISKELVSKVMTIKVLIKAIQIYGAKDIEVVLKVTWANGSKGEYGITEKTSNSASEHILEAMQIDKMEEEANKINEMFKDIE